MAGARGDRAGLPSPEALRRELAELRGRLDGADGADEELHRRLREVAPALPLAERFALLHELGIYHHPESASGAGSTLAETASLRAALPDLLRSEGVRNLLDLPCGDFHWMSRVDLAGVDYTGADIVPELVAANRERFEAPGRRFLLLDATRDPLPAVDLILCRDLLIHLSLADVAAVLRNFVRSGARLLLTTHFAASRENTEIPSGDFRPINLCAPPFHLPPPRRLVAEDSALGAGRYRDRAMALWALADLPPPPFGG